MEREIKLNTGQIGYLRHLASILTAVAASARPGEDLSPMCLSYGRLIYGENPHGKSPESWAEQYMTLLRAAVAIMVGKEVEIHEG